MVIELKRSTPASVAHTVLTVDVVICAHTVERWNDVQASIESALTQHRPPDRVIVVVDHEPALFARLNTLDLVTQSDNVVLLENSAARGLSGARNTGTAASTADVVAFLDDDAVAEPEWLDELMLAYSNPFVLGVGGASIPRWDLGRPGWFPEEFDWVVGCTYRGLPTSNAEVRNMIGSNMSFRRDVLVATGGFRTGLGRVAGSRVPMGNEETELCIRATRGDTDSLFVFAPSARVQHRVTGERGSIVYFTRRCWAEGLSKAATVRSAGGGKVLTTEREYVSRTLPSAVKSGIVDSIRKRRAAGAQRAAAIGLGVAVTGAGYVRGRLQPTETRDG